MKHMITQAKKTPDSLWSGGVLQHAAVQPLFNHEPPLSTYPSTLPQLQAKLKIGEPNDQYEQEADLIANAVVSGDLIPRSISPPSIGSLQRLRREPEKSKEDKLEELLEKLGEAALETPQFKQLLDRVENDPLYRSGEEFASTLTGKLSIGTLTAGAGAAVAAALIDASEEMPMQIPEIPLGGGHSVKLTINGPLDEPSDWSISYTFKVTSESDESSSNTSAETQRIGADIKRFHEQNEYTRAHTHIIPNSSETLTEKTARVYEDNNVDRSGRRPIQTTIPSFGDQKPKSELQLTQPTSSFGYKSEKPIIGKSLKLTLPSERKKREEETTLQRKSNNTGTCDSVPPIVHDVISSASQPLDNNIRNFMEERFGYDFSQIRVHSDKKAADSARAVNARAYTVGRDVVFGDREYVPDTYEGRSLIAHELAHTVQQSTAKHTLLQRDNNAETLQKVTKENIAGIVIEQLLDYRGQVEAGIRNWSPPKSDDSAAWFLTALAGNLVWASTAFLSSMVAAPIIGVISVFAAIIGSGTLKEIYELGLTAQTPNITSFVIGQVYKYVDALKGNTANVVDQLYDFFSQVPELMNANDNVLARRTFVWHHIFDSSIAPSWSNSTAIQNNTTKDLNKLWNCFEDSFRRIASHYYKGQEEALQKKVEDIFYAALIDSGIADRSPAIKKLTRFAEEGPNDLREYKVYQFPSTKQDQSGKVIFVPTQNIMIGIE
ncbi:DUF4157 domain-containing protein [uncultured Desulfobacter sp.]|uniref:eCIS core domain-containing protein n=1 Tax=uncultured Desulfobacter sp. TaxID=240139 RepID=UPI0029F5185E|nr:DUF4157 domain-containing protein [uncultured Desulfobacter sp.]